MISPSRCGNCKASDADHPTIIDTMAITINDLPDEVLQQIIFLLPPQDTLNSIQRLSPRFYKLANEPLLWRYHCRHQFKYWDSKHRIQESLSGSVGDVDWKDLYAFRCRTDADVTQTLNRILDSQVGRIKKFEQVTLHGYDVKDVLLRQSHTTNQSDQLARRLADPLTTTQLRLTRIDTTQMRCWTCFIVRRHFINGGTWGEERRIP